MLREMNAEIQQLNDLYLECLVSFKGIKEIIPHIYLILGRHNINGPNL